MGNGLALGGGVSCDNISRVGESRPLRADQAASYELRGKGHWLPQASVLGLGLIRFSFRDIMKTYTTTPGIVGLSVVVVG